MSRQARLFYEDAKDALTCALSESGKAPKAIALEMRPEMKADSAKAWLHNCLDPDKNEKFSIDQIIQFINLTKRSDGTNSLLDYICDETDHQRTVAKAPEDEMAQLQRAFINSVDEQKKLVERIQRTQLKTN